MDENDLFPIYHVPMTYWEWIYTYINQHPLWTVGVAFSIIYLVYCNTTWFDGKK